MSTISLLYVACIVQSHMRKSKVLVFMILMAEILGIFYHLRQKKKSQLLQALCAAVFM